MDVNTTHFDEFDPGYLIELSAGLVWTPYHSWGDGSDQIDARLVGPGGATVPGGLDLWAVDAARAECATETVAAIADTEAVWAAGDVLTVPGDLIGARSLMVPGAELSVAQVHEALRRFKP